MVSKLRAGVVWANTFNRFDPTSPFGGYKNPASDARAGCTACWRTSTWRRPLMVTGRHSGSQRVPISNRPRHVQRDAGNLRCDPDFPP